MGACSVIIVSTGPLGVELVAEIVEAGGCLRFGSPKSVFANGRRLSVGGQLRFSQAWFLVGVYGLDGPAPERETIHPTFEPFRPLPLALLSVLLLPLASALELLSACLCLVGSCLFVVVGRSQPL